MASILKVDELQGIATAGAITVTSEGGAATQSLQQGLAKCWANNKLQTTAETLDSFNQSSFSDDGTGVLTMSFSNAFSNDDYAPSGMSRSASSGTAYASSVQIHADLKSTTQLKVQFAYANAGSNAFYDIPQSGVILHGDLA